MYPSLHFPAADLTVKTNDINEVWDILRKKYVALTPEEWVRQHLIHYLAFYLDYPLGLMASEYHFVFNQRQKRADVVVFSDSGSPLMIVECKAPDVKINQGVAEQVSQYNFFLQVRYLLLTNGLDHYVFEVDKDKKQIISLSKIPEYKTINDEG